MSENPYSSPNPESDAAPLKTSAKFSLLHLLWMIPVGLVVIAFFIPAPRRSREAARRTQCKNNLKQIGLALHNYHDVYGTFPPAYTVDANGNRLHSWRTLILPFIDQAPLYEKIDFSKAWNDPANAEAAKTPLSIYRCPSSPVSGTGCSYVAIVSDRSSFPGADSRSILQITDGVNNTVMVVEVDAEKAVPWMSPTDVDEQFILSLGPKSKLSHTGGLHALMGDGAVRFLSYNLDGKVRQALMTIDAADTVGEF